MKVQIRVEWTEVVDYLKKEFARNLARKEGVEVVFMNRNFYEPDSQSHSLPDYLLIELGEEVADGDAA